MSTTTTAAITAYEMTTSFEGFPMRLVTGMRPVEIPAVPHIPQVELCARLIEHTATDVMVSVSHIAGLSHGTSRYQSVCRRNLRHMLANEIACLRHPERSRKERQHVVVAGAV
jgi:hypothetical protein